MWIENEPKVKKKIVCDLCGSHLLGADIQDLDWSDADMFFNEPFIKCPVCGNQIRYVLEEKKGVGK